MLKVMLYMAGTFRISSLGDSISSNPERTALRRRWEKSGYVEVLQQRAGNLNIKRLLLTKENQISKIKEFSTFLCMGRFKSLVSLKSFLWYAPQLFGASILCFHIVSFFRAQHREWLQSEGYYKEGILPFLSSLRAHQLTILWWLQLLITVTSFAYCYDRKSSISRKS